MHAPGVIRVELQRANASRECSSRPEQAMRAAEHEVRSGERGIDGGRLLCEPNRLVACFTILQVGPEEHAMGQAALAWASRGSSASACSKRRMASRFRFRSAVPRIACAKIERIRLGIVRAPLVDALALAGDNVAARAGRSATPPGSAHRENIGELTVVCPTSASVA